MTGPCQELLLAQGLLSAGLWGLEEVAWLFIPYGRCPEQSWPSAERGLLLGCATSSRTVPMACLAYWGPALALPADGEM